LERMAESEICLPYELVGPIGTDAILGLIILQSDETTEQEFKMIFNKQEIAFYVTRVPCGTEVTEDSLASMAEQLPAAASLLPPSLQYHVIGYGCTSGATVIGSERVSSLVKQTANTNHVTNPLESIIMACRTLKVQKIGLISPYIADVSAALRQALTDSGFKIQSFSSFNEIVDAKVARIDPISILSAVLKVGADPEIDVVFISCTNLRTMSILAEAEAKLGKPVISSNQALAWHMARLAGLPSLSNSYGSLMEHPLI